MALIVFARDAVPGLGAPRPLKGSGPTEAEPDPDQEVWIGKEVV